MRHTRTGMQRLILGLFVISGCRASYVAEAPELEGEDELVGVRGQVDEEIDPEAALDEKFGARGELPPRPTVKEVCKGKGSSRACTKKDPKPEVTAAYGARRFLEGMRWGMSRDEVLEALKREVEEEYQERQKSTRDPVVQDKNRNWKREELDKLSLNLVAFDTRTQHKWGVSLIQFEYADDAGETMLWLRSNSNLKKFYFFEGDKLWKVIYAYGMDSWPKEDHKQVKEDHFMKWFGYSPEDRVKQDPETLAPVVRFAEWKSMDNDIVRAFDLTAVHGVHVVALISGDAEARIGERLPHVVADGDFSDVVNDVLGGPAVCYDADGNFIEDAQKCAALELEE